MNFSHIDPSTSDQTQATLAKYQFLYSIMGAVLGLFAIVGGIYLFIQGITGSTTWDLKIFEAHSNISNAAPGAVLFIVGLFIIFITRYSFKHTNK